MVNKHKGAAFVSSPVTSNNRLLKTECEKGSKKVFMIEGIDPEFLGLTRDMCTAATIGAAGDVIAQFSEYQRNQKSDDGIDWDKNPLDDFLNGDESTPFEIDARRTAAYATFGFAYTGGFQHFVFSTLYDAIQDPLQRVSVSQGIVIPLCYYPFFYWLVPKLRARSAEERAQLRGNIDVLKMIPKNWAFWVPLQFLQFKLVPIELQVTYVAIVGVMWNFLLSTLTAGGNAPATTSAQLATTATDPSLEAEFVLPETLMSADVQLPSNSTTSDGAPVLRKSVGVPKSG